LEIKAEGPADFKYRMDGYRKQGARLFLQEATGELQQVNVHQTKVCTEDATNRKPERFLNAHLWKYSTHDWTQP